MTAKHTPGIFHIGMNPGPIVYSDKGAQIADCMSISNDHAENVANAQFIVRACNAHEDLIVALMECITESGAHCMQGDNAAGLRVRIASINAIALAAIAKAEGKA
jgi:hypothetical protein